MPREVKEAEQVVIADVEEEVVRARVVAVLHQFDQREAQELLVELDRLLGIFTDQREVMHTADGCRGAVCQRAQIPLAQVFPAGPDAGKLLALWLWHWLTPYVATPVCQSSGFIRCLNTQPCRPCA